MTSIQIPLRKLSLAILAVTAWTTHANANDLSMPFSFDLSVDVVVSACGVHVSEANKNVKLGYFSKRQFYQAGTTTASQMIPFELASCPPEIPVSITFTGTTAPNHPEFLAISNAVNAASGIAIELLNADKQRLILGEKNMFKSNKEGEISTVFYAHYIAIQDNVSVGTAHATATFKIEHH